MKSKKLFAAWIKCWCCCSMKHGPNRLRLKWFRNSMAIFQRKSSTNSWNIPWVPEKTLKNKRISFMKQFQGSVGIFWDKKILTLSAFWGNNLVKTLDLSSKSNGEFLWFISPQAGPQMGPSIDVSEVAHGSKWFYHVHQPELLGLNQTVVFFSWICMFDAW